MAGFIKQEGEASAKRVGTSAPFSDLDLGMLGSVEVGLPGTRPVAQTHTAVEGLQNRLINTGRDASINARGFVDPTAAFGREALAGGTGMLADVAGFDPLNAAEERFGRLSSILAKGRDQQRAGLEERMFRQGRLDSGLGDERMGELESGFADVDANLLNKLFLEGEAAQANARSQALGMGQAGAAIGGGLFGQAMQAPQAAQQLDQGLLQALGASGSIGQQFLNKDIARSNAINSFNASPAAGGQGGGMIPAIGAIGGGLLGSVAGPAGTLAGAQTGMALGNLFT